MEPWLDSRNDVHVAFLGRGAGPSPKDALTTVDRAPTEASWLRQTHSTRLVSAAPGFCGSGDGLLTRQGELALTVFTADCVPLLMAGSTMMAAVHVGWRGFVAGIVERAIQATQPAEKVVAWIGPAIGPCCYEVGDDVAQRIEGRAPRPIRYPGAGDRPHVDLPGAVEAVLLSAGVAEVRHLRRCTSCHPDDLWSYRRSGTRAGRNYSFLWSSAT